MVRHVLYVRLMPRLVFAPNSADPRAIEFDRDTLTVGQADDNHICVRGPGIARHHLRFERRNDMVYVVDLGSEAGTFVDGRRVDRFVLGHRAVVRAGELEILYLEDTPSSLPAVVGPLAVDRAPNGPSGLMRETTCPNCGAALPSTATLCARCGMMLPQGGGGVPATADVFVRPSPLARGAGILPMLSFFFSLFGPLILGIGWLLGIIFGFISLSLLRQRGGFLRDRRNALWGIGLGFTWLAILVLAGVWFVHHRREQQARVRIEKTIQQNETDVAYLLKEIAVIEEFLKSSQAIPLEQGGSGFATLKQLRALPNPFLPVENLQDQNKGYLFSVRAHWGDDFLASAVPLQYGVTGRKTFSIDQTGVLRGADIGGKQPWEYNAVLPELELGRSVYIESRERIARELLTEARRLAEEKKFDRSQFILKELQKRYVLTETFQNFENVAKGVEQLIINAQAQEAFDKVQPLLAEGRKAEAAARLKQIAATYPTAATIEEIKQQAARLEAELAAERNQMAARQWAEAVRLDQEGKADEALAAYRAFAAQFADTQTFASNKGNYEGAVARIEESKASGLFATLAALDVRTNAAQVLAVASRLQGSFPHAPTVKANLTMLRGLQQQAQAQVYAEEGTVLMNQQRYLEASERFDRALALNPSLLKDLAESLELCYFQAGEAYFGANKMAEASAAYEKFLQITPNPEKLEKARLKQIYLSLAEINYLNKNYTNATVYLKKGVEFFGNEPKYYRMYGQSFLRLRQFEEALPAYQSLVSLARDDPQARFERGLCLLGTLDDLQTNLVHALTVAATTNAPIAAPETTATALAHFILPPSVTDKKLKAEETEVLKEKQLELRLSDTLQRLKSYTAQTPEATVIREAVRLVNEVQASSTELANLQKDAKTEVTKSKITRARNQLLSVFTTQQDYFDRIISDKITLKQDILTRLDRMKTSLETAAADITAASAIEAYRGAAVEMNDSLQKKLSAFNAGHAQLKPVLEAEIKSLEEARTLIRLAVSQFRGWAIGWNLNDRIEKFFQINYSEQADRKAQGEKLVRSAVAIAVPFEKHITP